MTLDSLVDLATQRGTLVTAIGQLVVSLATWMSLRARMRRVEAVQAATISAILDGKVSKANHRIIMAAIGGAPTEPDA